MNWRVFHATKWVFWQPGWGCIAFEQLNRNLFVCPTELNIVIDRWHRIHDTQYTIVSCMYCLWFVVWFVDCQAYSSVQLLRFQWTTIKGDGTWAGGIICAWNKNRISDASLLTYYLLIRVSLTWHTENRRIKWKIIFYSLVDHPRMWNANHFGVRATSVYDFEFVTEPEQEQPINIFVGRISFGSPNKLSKIICFQIKWRINCWRKYSFSQSWKCLLCSQL